MIGKDAIFDGQELRDYNPYYMIGYKYPFKIELVFFRNFNMEEYVSLGSLANRISGSIKDIKITDDNMLELLNDNMIDKVAETLVPPTKETRWESVEKDESYYKHFKRKADLFSVIFRKASQADKFRKQLLGYTENLYLGQYADLDLLKNYGKEFIELNTFVKNLKEQYPIITKIELTRERIKYRIAIFTTKIETYVTYRREGLEPDLSNLKKFKKVVAEEFKETLENIGEVKEFYDTGDKWGWN